MIPSCKAASMALTTFIVNSSTIQMHFICSSVNTINTHPLPFPHTSLNSTTSMHLLPVFQRAATKQTIGIPLTTYLEVFPFSLTTSQLAY